ncbi:3-oxoadipate enol-lactonase [Ruegeria arenilitoris]|uniref:3-oxoadipate enol-lactonase n=1 Tax=Ruegeria arenilitoris TaxID=1173585 RepID=UPI00147A641C|nr:3-oxoadipate enol-lactonase [Ruegeria arenilitoris]
MRMADLKSVQLHWREDGSHDGHVVVFANSLGTDLRLWDKIIPLLPIDYRLIRFDLRGHGLSSCPSGPYSIDELVSDTEDLMDHLDVSSCVFVGLSIGGMIGQALAARRPDLIKSMVLSNTAAQMGGAKLWQDRVKAIRSSGIEGLSEQILDRWFGPDFRDHREVNAWRNMLTRTPVEGYVGCCLAIAEADLSFTTPTLRLPTLGIAGTMDGASPPDLVRHTINMIPNARFELIEGAGHLPCVEKPAQYADLLTEFLKETFR